MARILGGFQLCIFNIFLSIVSSQRNIDPFFDILYVHIAQFVNTRVFFFSPKLPQEYNITCSLFLKGDLSI